MTPHYWNDAKAYLSNQCPTMAQLIARYEEEGLAARGEGFYTLIRSIAGQQISVKAADSIWRRFAAAVDPMTPENLLAQSDAVLRGCGFSASKVAYARNVAEYWVGKKVTPEFWNVLSDGEVIKELTSIKGIGSWTAEMFLIFHLLRPDVLPLKDLGLLKAIDLHYTGGKRLSPKEYQRLSAPWAPYRTVATWYLWRALDPVPVAY